MGLQFVRETRNIFFFPCIAFTLFIAMICPVRLVAQEKTSPYYADPASLPPPLPFTLKHVTARVSFQPEKNMVTGKAEFMCTPNTAKENSLVFNTPEMIVSSVTMNGIKVKFHQTGDSLVIDEGFMNGSPSVKNPFPETPVVIEYTSTPKNGPIYFIGWRPEEAGKRKQIWAHRPNGWIPYIAGRVTVDMFITFDSAYKVFSNGERVEVKANGDGTKTWHYVMKKDHPFFSTSLVIGDYNYTNTKTSRGVPLEFWYYPDMPDRVGTTYMYSEQMFDFFEKELGFDYPYPVYREAPVIDYMYGAMETTTSTVFGDYMQISPRSWWQRNYVNVNAHELAHQWFGNCVAHLANRDVWLTESFATYYAKLFERSIFGDNYYENIRNDEMRAVFEAAKKNDFPVGGSQGGVQRIYQKGSLVLDMLRDVVGGVGGDRFSIAVNLYLNKTAFSYAETSDFLRCLYLASGTSYNWFFEEWILRGGEPDYLVTDSIAVDDSGKMNTVFKVRQVQKVSELNGLFKMPVTFGVYYPDGDYDITTTWVEKETTFVSIPNPKKKKIDYLLFDPNRRILKKVTFTQPFERLVSQAMKANNMIDRYDAWVALRAEPVSKKTAYLTAAFLKERFWLIRSEILQQLAADHSPETIELFRQALLVKDANVRKAALLALNPIPDLLQSTVEGLLYDESYLNVEYALDALCTSFPKSAEYYLDLTRDMEGWRGKNIRMMWLSLAIAGGKTEYRNELINYCGPKFEFETRMNAFNVLKKLKYADPETIKYAEVASKHWNNKLSGVAKEYVNWVKK